MIDATVDDVVDSCISSVLDDCCVAGDGSHPVWCTPTNPSTPCACHHTKHCCTLPTVVTPCAVCGGSSPMRSKHLHRPPRW
jgi:hypothetical protein